MRDIVRNKYGRLAVLIVLPLLGIVMTEIGRAFKRDHPAVKNAIARVERQVLERAPLRYQLEALTARLKERTSDPAY